MAECGICLDALRDPVSIPCGHVQCERCLRGHISSGADALKSTCPTCRKPFHIATPHFAFVPKKYHDFILPSVRKIYMDIPSIATMTAEIDTLTQRLDAFAKENEHLRRRCADYKYTLESMASEKYAIIEQEEEAREEAADLRKKYDSLKKKYWESRPRDNACNICKAMPSQSPSRRNSQNLETSREFHPKVEEHPVSLQDMNPNPPRPKRALPRPRLSNGTRRKDEQPIIFVKRQRTHQHSDVGSSSSQLLPDKGEEEGEGEGDE